MLALGLLSDIARRASDINLVQKIKLKHTCDNPTILAEEQVREEEYRRKKRREEGGGGRGAGRVGGGGRRVYGGEERRDGRISTISLLGNCVSVRYVIEGN